MKKGIKKLASIAIMAALIYFIGQRIAQQWAAVSEFEWHVDWVPLFLSLMLLFLGFLNIAFIWILIQRALGEPLRLYDGFKIYFFSSLGRYVPGKVWQVASAARLAKENGYSGPQFGAGMVYLIFLNLQAGGLLTLLGIVYSKTGQQAGISGGMVSAILILVLFSTFIPAIANLTMRVLNRFTAYRLPQFNLPLRSVVILFGFTLFHWFVESFAYFIMIRSFYPIAWPAFTDLIFVVSLSTTIGFLAIFAPAGLGVREGLMLALFPFFMPEAVATVAAIGSRLWYTLADVASILLMVTVITFYGKLYPRKLRI